MIGFALFIHVAAAMGIFSGLAVEWVLVARLEGARSGQDMDEALRAFAVLPKLGAPSTILVLASGIYLASATAVWGDGWPTLALIGLLLIGLSGALLGGGRAERAASNAGSAPPHEARVPRPALLRRSIVGRIWIGLGVLFLMTDRPDPLVSAIVLGTAVALGAVTLALPGSPPSGTAWNGRPRSADTRSGGPL